MVTGGDVEAALRAMDLMTKLIHDSDLSGDLLLLALGLVERATRVPSAGGGTLTAVANAVGFSQDRLRSILARDIPHYEVPIASGYGCVHPMVRREGLCGKPGRLEEVVVNPRTGERQRVAYCSRHYQQVRRQLELERAEWFANGSPQPPPNAGGVLPRYFATDWDRVWRWASPWRYQQGLKAPPSSPPRPVLRLVTSDN